MDAKRGTMGQGRPTVTTLGTVPERGKFRAAKPGCRARLLFGYFLFRASKEKVTRRKGETDRRGRRRIPIFTYWNAGVTVDKLRVVHRARFYLWVILFAA